MPAHRVVEAVSRCRSEARLCSLARVSAHDVTHACLSTAAFSSRCSDCADLAAASADDSCSRKRERGQRVQRQTGMNAVNVLEYLCPPCAPR